MAPWDLQADQSGWLQAGQRWASWERPWECAWHRRKCGKRSAGKQVARLTDSLVRVCHHHGSQPPKMLTQALSNVAGGTAWPAPTRSTGARARPTQPASSASLHEALQRWGLPEADDSAILAVAAVVQTAPEGKEHGHPDTNLLGAIDPFAAAPVVQRGRVHGRSDTDGSAESGDSHATLAGLGAEAEAVGSGAADQAAGDESRRVIQLIVEDRQCIKVQFDIRRATPLRKLMHAYCSRFGLQCSQVRFTR